MQGNGRIRGFLAGLALAALASGHPHQAHRPDAAAAPALPAKPEIYIETYVTGYNTVPGQTDDTPCVAASGANICGRRDTIACPPLLPLGAVVEIRGKKYVCEDRMARKYRTRFDINCDKDIRCPYQVTGWTEVKVVLDQTGPPASRRTPAK
jgi:hypothetical protein